jgi:hypothetical protein
MVELQIDFIPADEFIKKAGIGVTDYIFIKVLGFLSPITHHPSPNLSPFRLSSS